MDNCLGKGDIGRGCCCACHEGVKTGAVTDG